MNPGQTTAETQSQLIQGWLTSLILHGFLLCTVILSVRQSLVTLSPERFQWDVTLVQSTQIPEVSTPSTDVAAQPIGETPTPAITAVHQSPRTATPYTKTVKTVQPIIDPKGMKEPQPESSSSMRQTVSQSESTITNPTAIQPQTTDGRLQHEVTSPNPQARESATPETTTVSSGTVGDPISSTVDPSPSLAATTTPVETVSAPRSDYGWLQQAIFRRLEELKRTSRPQLDGLQPLKVLVKAVVSQDGTLLGSEVVKSSGLDRIDQEAMALVQRAFPMQFDRTVDRRQIIMRIPISYSRD